MIRLPVLRALMCLLLVTILSQPFSAAANTPAATPSGGSSKIIVQAADKTALRRVAQANGELLADYGSFSLWRVNDAAATTLKNLAGVSYDPAFDAIYLRDRSIDTRQGPDQALPAALKQSVSTAEQLWLVQFVGPTKDEWLESVAKTGAEIVAYMPNNAYVVWADGQAIDTLNRLASEGKELQWTGAFHPAYRLAPQLLGLPAGEKDAMVSVTVQIHTTAGSEQTLAALRSYGGEVRKNVSRTLNFTNITLDVPTSALSDLARRPDVFNIEPWAAPVKLDERQNQIIAGNITTIGSSPTTNVVPSGPGYLAWLNGQGLPSDPSQYPIVDIVDDGIDNGSTTPLHPDFYVNGIRPGTSRLSYNGNCTTDATGNAVGGHGNLNAGIVGGFNNSGGSAYVDGSSSGISGGYRYGLGVAPHTRLAGTKIFRNAGPYNIDNCGGTDQGVVAASYNGGAAITSNSWGCGPGGSCGPGGVYDASSQAYDALTRDASAAAAGNQQMLHVFAAGNDGPGADTIGTPGTAKNVISVGATENTRDNGFTDGCGESSNDDADDVVGFSSRGPTDDGRIKPDIMAPGSHIVGPASQDPGFNGNGVCNQFYPAGQTLYAMSSGTSHSTPAVAGAASLLYTYYRLYHGGVAPSPAMLKAYMLNSTRYLNGASSGGTLPSTNQGWGDVYLKQAFDQTPKLFFDQTTVFGATGQEFAQDGTIAQSNQPFRVSLVWTDAPGNTTGNAYVNNLNLEVIVGGQTYKGNVFNGATSTTGGTADAKNNVENVYLPAGVSGSFTVKVTAANIAGDGLPGNADTTDQDFALVIYNGATGPSGGLTGTVKHPSNTPIAGAQIKAGNRTALSDATGRYTMTLPIGTYAVTATLSGYSSQSVPNITITQNTTATQDFILAGGAISGIVSDAFAPSQPIAGATVSLDGGETTTTDSAGRYTFARASVGAHTVTATKAPQYGSVSATVTVSDDATASANLTLPGGALVGSVTDATNGQPLAGATVSLGGQNAVTGAAGGYALRAEPGNYALSVSKFGYASRTLSGIAITSGITSTTNVVLTPTFGYQPAALSRSFVFGSAALTDANDLILSNNSGAPFTYTLSEAPGAIAPPTANKAVLLVYNSTAPSAANDAALQALVAAGYTPTSVTSANFEAKTVTELLTYAAVVYIGEAGNSNSGASNVKLMAYLDAGGRLLIGDNDLGYVNRTTFSTFYRTYLDATYSADNATSKNDLRGEGIMAGINTSVNGDSFPDSFTYGSASTRIFKYGATNLAGGTAIVRQNYKAIYLSFDFHQLGTATVGESVETTVMQRSIAWLTGGLTGDFIPWLTETPASAAIPAQSSADVAIGWFPNKVDQPGTYTGTLNIGYTAAPTQTIKVPVTMVVTPAPSQARISGTVTSSGVCDTGSQPLAGAQITISSSGGFSTTLTTDASGAFSYYVPAAGTYTVAAAAAEHQGQSGDVTVAAGDAAERNFVLRLQKPCVAVAPAQLSATLAPTQQATRPFTITSSGALPLTYRVIETVGRTGVIGIGALSAADPFGYAYGSGMANWIDATGGTALTLSDDGEANITLPFAFPYYGITTNQLRVGNNGGVLLNVNSGELSNTNADLGGTAPNNFIAPYWDDLDDEQGGVFWKVLGAAPNRMAVIQWNNRPHYPGSPTANTGTFELVLYENGNIAFQYLDVQFDSLSLSNGSSATIGIRGASATDRLQYSFNTASTLNGRALCFIRPGNPSCGAADIPWLSTNPISGTLSGTPASQQTVVATFDSGSLQPGAYQAQIAVIHNGPQPTQFITASLTVTNPPTFGTFSGTVRGLGACAAPGAPLAGAVVTIAGSSTVTTTTDINGAYSYALPAGNYSLAVAAAGYVGQTTNATLTAQQTSTVDFSLKPTLPCQQVAPAALSSAQATNTVVSQTLTISNTGDAALTWAISERGASRPTPNPVAQSATRRTQPGRAAAAPGGQAPAANLIQDSGLEATTSGGTNPYWASTSTNFGTVLSTPPSGLPAHSGTYLAWFGTSASYPTEIGTLEQSVTIPNGTATLSFWLLMGSAADRPNDFMKVKIDGTQVFAVTNLDKNNYPDWTQVTVPVNAFANGAAHTIRFESTIETGGNTNFFVDDIVLDSQAELCSANALPWLTVAPVSGTVAPASSADITVAFNSAGMTSGTYTGSLCLRTNDPIQPSTLVSVTMTVGAPQAVFGAESVESTQAAGQVVTKSLALSNTANLAVSWTLHESDGAAAGCSAANELPWLSAAPASGTIAGSASATLTLTFNSAGMAAGTHTGTLCLVDSATQTTLDTIAVSLHVEAQTSAVKLYLPLITK